MGESPVRFLSRFGAHGNVLDASLFLLQKKVGHHHLDKRLYKTFPDTYAIGCQEVILWQIRRTTTSKTKITLRKM